MLILTRRPGEKIVIGDEGEILVEVLNVRHGDVKFGITAPDDVTILREELIPSEQGKPDDT